MVISNSFLFHSKTFKEVRFEISLLSLILKMLNMISYNLFIQKNQKIYKFDILKNYAK